MNQTTDPHMPTGRATLNTVGDRRATALARLSIGLIQGLTLWWLFEAQSDTRAWPATQPLLFWPLLLVFAYLPIVLLAGVGRLRLRTMVIWGCVAAATLALLAWHAIARQSVEEGNREFTPVLLAFSAVALFIAHHLIVPADRERRLIAAFPAYFDAAWLAGVQLALSVGFTGVFWLLLFLGAALFNIIGLEFLMELIRQPFFSIPLTTLTFSVAVQLTDVREGLIRGVRTIALMLLSWLLLVLTVLVAGFLSALPFTGLDGLWETGNATALVLTAAAGLIILINTAYQDGRTDNLPPVVLRAAVRIAAVLITPLVIIAMWGLALRIGQHGLTPDRIIAAACALIGAAYAVGYGFAALVPFVRKAGWMTLLERTNIVTAVLAIAIILALFTPLADPARLSVEDQVARLKRGAVAPEAFDFEFLASGSGSAGQAALMTLTRSDNPTIARLAAQAKLNAEEVPLQFRDQTSRPVAGDIVIRPNPATVPLPKTFTGQYGRMLNLLGDCRRGSPCEAKLMDLDRDGSVEILVAKEQTVSVFKHEADGRWIEWAEYHRPSCVNEETDLTRPFAAEEVVSVPPIFPDLVVGGVRLRVQVGDIDCPIDD